MVYELIVAIGLDSAPGVRPSMHRYELQTEKECEEKINDLKKRLPHAKITCNKIER